LLLLDDNTQTSISWRLQW